MCEERELRELRDTDGWTSDVIGPGTRNSGSRRVSKAVTGLSSTLPSSRWLSPPREECKLGEGGLRVSQWRRSGRFCLQAALEERAGGGAQRGSLWVGSLWTYKGEGWAR